MKKRILAVDDSKTMRDMVSFTLKDAGYDVMLAEDGEHALKSIGGERIDLVITDVNMPKMDGISLVKALRADPRHRATPILVLTTEGQAEKKNEGRQAGATGWIVKPFDPTKLVQVVQKVCP